MRRIIWNWVISSLALWLATHALSRGITMPNPWDVLWIAPLLGLINALVAGLAWLLSLLAFPITLLTLGCFGFVVSFLLYTWAISGLFGRGGALDNYLMVDGFLWAAALAAVMALFSTVLNMVLPGGRKRR